MAVVDIDGTLSGGGDIVSERVVNAVRAVCGAGYPVCVCTGRNAAAARPVTDRLATGMPYAAIDGLAIFDGKNEILERHKLPPEVLAGCAERAYKNGLYMEAVTDLYYNKYIELNKAYDYGLGRLDTCACYHDKFDTFLAAAASCCELILGGEESKLAAFRQGVQHDYGGAVGLRRSLWAGYLFVTAPSGEDLNGDTGCGKGYGCRRLAARFGFGMEEVVAIGDDLNDLDMLSEAGMGVAMGNGAERAKAAAKYVAPSVEDDGVAFALERFFS